MNGNFADIHLNNNMIKTLNRAVACAYVSVRDEYNILTAVRSAV